MPEPESTPTTELDRDWGLAILNGLSGAREFHLPDAAREFARQFESQFASPVLQTRFYFRLLGAARALLSDLCWPGASRLVAVLGPMARDPRYRPLMESLLGGEPFSPSQLIFATEGAACDWMEHALAWLAANPPARAASSVTRPVEIQIPKRLDALKPQWERGGRTCALAAIAHILARDLPAGATPILFGSLAEDGPWPAYADVDLALWISDPAPRAADFRHIAAAFRRAAPTIVQVDPLQHHGPFIFFDLDASLFAESRLPADTLRRASLLKPDASLPSLLCSPIHDRLPALLALAQLCRGALNIAARPRLLGDRYMAKYLVSLVLLSPALTLAALGEPSEKAASFDKLKPRLSAPARATLEAFERLRLDWRWTLSPPRMLLQLTGGKTHALARNLNRWPAPALARRLTEITPGLELLFKEFFGLISTKP